VSSVRILGPVEAWANGERLVLGGPRQVALLAVLALRANRAVSSDVLIDALWGEQLAGARKRLQMAVVRLRQALAPLEADGKPVVRTVRAGYLLALPEGELDAELFQRRLEEGRAALRDGDPARASERLSAALGLWRGPPLAEVGYEEFAQIEIRRLEELRLLALGARVQAELELGHHAEVIAELEALLVEQPSRERVASQLMLALYRCGRQADALEVYQRTRAHLAQELGLEPGPELTSLQLAILKADQELLQVPATAAGEHAGASLAGLPASTTPFLGRKRELAAAIELLRRTRLLTLTGAGGSGKTRLGLRMAEACAEDYGDGAVFVGFADITDPELIVPTISHALGLAEVPNKTPVARLKGWLSQRELLLVLDNLEQLAPGTSVLGELSTSCPGVRMIVTSREPLHIRGEQQYEVPVLEPEDAVELFVARAGAVAPHVSIGREIASAICERLDRLPLAIELTAARAKTLSPPQMLDRLEHHLPVAAGGPRDAPRRQRTLQATADWSYALLNTDEQRLFVRTSVFAGGFALPAAEAVCDADLDTLTALVDRSVVKTDGERYWMLQTLRDYALDKLARTGEEGEIRRKHAQWFVELLETEHLPQPGRPTEASMVRVALEQVNLRSALEWTWEHGMTETVARLASSLAEVWIRLGHLHEAKRWIGPVLEGANHYPDRLAAQVVSAARALAWHQGDHAQAMALAQRALVLWQRVGDQYAIGRETMSVGRAACSAGDLIRGRSNFNQAIQFAREHDLTELLQASLNGLGDIEIREGNLMAGQSLCEQSRAVAVPGSTTGVVALLNLAHVAMLQADHAKARALVSEALDHALARGDRLTLAWGSFELAWELGEQGELEAAGRLLGAAVGFLDAVGAKRDWFVEACEAAITTALHNHLDATTAQALLDQGRSISLEDAVRQARETAAPVHVGEPHASGPVAVRLPVPTTPFLGRERELAVAVGLLRKTRLLTLTGAGGSGKTRLALRLAQARAEDYRDGVVFVGFADITDPELIVPTITQALGLSELTGKTPIERLCDSLARRELLLVLDNLEQLTSGTAVLSRLLSGCPAVSMLVTSREPLHLAGEQQYEVPLLRSDDAVELFVARARAVAPDVDIDREIAAAICERLDRLPLAIELTAARAKTLSLPHMLDRLEHRLPVATAGPRDAPNRQRTLRATTDWSYDLLSPEEQQLFARLSVFAGGFTLAAAEAVCAANLETLTALVDRSLIKAEGERYWMLQTLREYALKRLELSGEAESVRGAHAQFLVRLLELEQLPQPGWPDANSLERLRSEQENFTAALEWAYRTGRSEILARLAGPLVGVWLTLGRLLEAHRWMKLVLENQASYSGRLAAEVLLSAAVVARHDGDYEEGVALGRLALAHWREVGDVRAIGMTLLEIGASKGATAAGAREERAALEQAIEFARENALADVLAAASANYADLLISIGSVEEARALCEQSRAASAGKSGSLWTSTAWVATSNLAYIEMAEGHTAKAERLGREALEISLARGDLLALAWGAIFMAWPLAGQGQLGWSARLLGAGLEFLTKAGARREWMDRACEAAVLDLLYPELDRTSVDALFEEGRTRGLERVARDVLALSPEGWTVWFKQRGATTPPGRDGRRNGPTDAAEGGPN
jgi:predicted ATPase/DNA-binding SARP family transcriptional activator